MNDVEVLQFKHRYGNFLKAYVTVRVGDWIIHEWRIEARSLTSDAEREYQEVVKQTINNVKAHNSVIADAYSMAIQLTDSQKKQGEVQKELDALNEKIAARGPVRTAIIKNEKMSTEELRRTQLELAVAQEDLAGVQQKEGESAAEFALRVDTLKGKVADYSTKLGEHTAVVGGATKAELEQKKALEEQNSPYCNEPKRLTGRAARLNH